MAGPIPVDGSIDTLRNNLSVAGSDAERLVASYALARALAGVAPGQAETLFREAAALARKLDDYPKLAGVGREFCQLLCRLERFDEAEKCARWVEEAADATGSGLHRAEYAYLSGSIAQDRADYATARRHYEQARELWQAAGSLEGADAALNQLGALLSLQGRPAEALEYYQQCLAIQDERKDEPGRAFALYNIGFALSQLGRWEEAVGSCYRALSLVEQFGPEWLRAYVCNCLGEVFLGRDKLDKAVEMFRQAMAPEGPGATDAVTVRSAMVNVGRALLRRGDIGSARQTLEQALAVAIAANSERDVVIARLRLAEVGMAEGRIEQAAEDAAAAISLARALGLRLEEGEACRVHALALSALGRPDAARQDFEAALAVLAELEESLELARARFHFGRFLLAEGERESAVPRLRSAARTFRKLGVVADADEVNRLLFRIEVGDDRETALLSAVSALAAMGLEPLDFLGRAQDIVREALRFDSAVLLVNGQPVLHSGRPDMARAMEAGMCAAPVTTADSLCWPVASGGRALGTFFFERSAPAESAPGQLILDTVVNLLAAPLERVASVVPAVANPPEELSQLRYRGIVGTNAKVLACLETAGRVARTAVPVLVLGESGSGKELVARALHDSSPRAGRTFIAVNCAALPEDLLEAEFFGVEKGTATGVAARAGKFEQADGGTVFLDEIGDMSAKLQAKLLRVLQEGAFERVGGRQPINVDVRIVAATNQDLGRMMNEGRFRRDLYYRLNTVELTVPALRDRREDLPELVRYFIGRSNEEFGREVTGVSSEAMVLLGHCRWPGNIRQLQHTIERAVLLARTTVITPADLPAELQAVPPEPPVGGEGLRVVRRAARRIEPDDEQRAMILDCLNRAGWNVTAAAKLAGYSRAQFYRLIGQHGVTRRRD
jgi:DNA-binding NtrC family response regulator/tetratricopeptide (TPR) repeat protein